MPRRKRMRMIPDPNDERTWSVATWVARNWAWICSGGLAIAVACLRVYYHTGRISGKDIAEAFLIGILVAVLKPVADLAGVTDEWAPVIAAVVAALGAKVTLPIIEQIATRFVDRRIK